MNCFISHSSPWMQKKCLGFLRTFLETYKFQIDDGDVFALLDFCGAEEMIAQLIRQTFPEKLYEKLTTHKTRGYLMELDDDPLRVTLQGLWNIDEARPWLKAILPALFEKVLSFPWGEPGEKDVFHERMLELQRTLKLDDTEIDILLVSMALNEHFLWTPTQKWNTSSAVVFMLVHCLNLKEALVLDYVSPRKPLRRFDCLDDDLEIIGSLLQFLSGLTDEPLANNYFTRSTEEPLPWSDFADLVQKHGTILKRMLTCSGKPVNILLYGVPGTGKTSFAHALAKEIGLTCYCIAQNTSDRSGRTNSSPSFRFGALQVCDCQIASEGSLIIVDEADEMLRGVGGFGNLFMMFGGGASASVGDKGLLNTVLDTMKTSTIWITNTPAGALDESSRRRFDYSICFEPLNHEQRKRIWKNNIARLKMGRLISKQQVEDFSSLYPVSAGGISQTLENLARMHPRKAEVARLVDQLMKPHCELLGVKLADDKLLPSKDYSLEGLNIQGDVKLERIVQAVRAFQRQTGKPDPDRPRMNILLSGAPGTGKTEFVKYLGNALKTKVKVVMGSDLLNKYVGDTERNIVRVFRQAEAEHAILFLDEIDGLVQNRANANNVWEVTQVNELLNQMENFNGVMIGATNFLQGLDPAIMRRFTFKLQFDYLDKEGKALFFKRMFKASLTEAEHQRLNAIPNLAPGDFRTVRQSFFYYGGDVTNEQLLDALETEAAAKTGRGFTQKGRIGF